jgi:hypothetical protein
MNQVSTTTSQHSIGSARQPGYKWVGDRELSTYRWSIFLKDRQDIIIEGYSKDVKSREKDDKQQLLQDCIIRLANKGYLDKCYYWVIFKREYMNKDADTVLLELNPHGYMTHGALTLDLSTIAFLDRIFTARKTGLGVGFNYKTLLPYRETNKQKRIADFTFSFERFPNATALGKYCREHLLPKYERNHVLAWYNANEPRYSNSQRQPEYGDATRLAGPTYAGQDVDNEKAAQLAQQAMLNLQNQFTRGK